MEVATAKKEALESVSKQVVDLASKAGFGGEVHVVDEEPRAFSVGGKDYKEAGHYDPRDHSITINARNAYADTLPALVSHEVMHHKWDTVTAERDREHKEMQGELIDKGEYDRLLRASGEPRDEAARTEIEKRWPVSALFGKTLGDGYIEMGSDRDAMQHDDGITDYSKAYWDEYWSKLLKTHAASEQSAINETLAEMAHLKQQHKLVESPRAMDMAQKQLEDMGYKIKRSTATGEPYVVNRYTETPAVFKSRSPELRLANAVRKGWAARETFRALGHPSWKWNQLFSGINTQYDRLMKEKHAKA